MELSENGFYETRLKILKDGECQLDLVFHVPFSFNPNLGLKPASLLFGNT
jgi:hypothetical protein